MTETVFITGATGTVGKNLIPLFLKQTRSHLILLIHKQGQNQPKAALLRSFNNNLTRQQIDRVTLINGDITQKKLGLSINDQKIITSSTTIIIHAAATTRFDLPITQARFINVTGTRNVITVALKCKQTPHFAFISTAYISGKRTGMLYEDSWQHAEGFVNNYEQSKYEAEILLNKYRNRLPIATYRLSTIVGDSQTGAVTHYTAPHQALRVMYLGLAGVIPGSPDYVVDMISSDFTASTLFQLISKHFQSNKFFHITSGAHNSYTLSELIDVSYALLCRYGKNWKEKQYPKPLFVDAEAFDLFMKSAETSGNILLTSVMQAMKHFAHQLNYKKEFNNDNLLHLIPDYNTNAPHINTYYKKVVQYCLHHRWKTI